MLSDTEHRNSLYQCQAEPPLTGVGGTPQNSAETEVVYFSAGDDCSVGSDGRRRCSRSLIFYNSRRSQISTKRLRFTFNLETVTNQISSCHLFETHVATMTNTAASVRAELQEELDVRACGSETDGIGTTLKSIHL